MDEPHKPEEAHAVACRRKPTPEEAAESRAAIFEAAGSWKDIDVEAFKAYVAERRCTANRPSIKLQTLLDCIDADLFSSR